MFVGYDRLLESAISIPMGFDLIPQRHDAVVFTIVLHDAGQSSFDVRILNEQTHAAAQFTLNTPGGRSNTVFDVMLQQKIPRARPCS